MEGAGTVPDYLVARAAVFRKRMLAHAPSRVLHTDSSVPEQAWSEDLEDCDGERAASQPMVPS
jgi:hypothetical protein